MYPSPDPARWLDHTSFYAAMIEKASEGICVCHAVDEFPYLRFTIWNKCLTDLTGYTMEEINRKGWYQSVYPDPILQQKAIERMRLIREGHDLSDEQWEITRKGGRKINLRITTYRLTTDDNIVQVVAFMQDITGQIQISQKAQWETEVNKVLAEVAALLISPKTINDISTIVLDHAKRLTKSQFGYVGYIDLKTNYLICPTMTPNISEKCEISDKDASFKRYHGLWGWVLQNKTFLMTNDPQNDPRAGGTPPGHIKIRRFLAVPANYDNQLVGQIALANATRDYTQDDVDLIGRMAVFYAVAIQRKRFEDELVVANLKLERDVDERMAELAASNRQLKLEIIKNRESESALRKSEERFRALVRSSHDHIFMLDQKGRYLFSNKRHDNMGIHSPDELLHRSIEEVYPADVARYYREQLNHVLFTRKPVDFEHHLYSGDGYIFHHDTLYPLFKGDKIFAVGGICRDITGAKQAEQALRRSEQKFKAMLSALSDNISMIDRELKIVWANDFAKNTFGHDIEGKNCCEVYHCSRPPIDKSQCPARLAFYTSGVSERQVEAIDHAGVKRIFHCKASVALRDSDGLPETVIEISRDITDRQRTMAELQQKEVELKKHNKRFEEVNTALEVLLQRRAQEKVDFQKNIVANLERLVFPYLSQLKISLKRDKEKAYLTLIENNLNELISPFGRTIMSEFIHLTPTELRITDFIKQGMTSKEIADNLHVSTKAIAFHRGNIRKKLGLSNKKTNLRTYLESVRKISN